MTMKRKMFLVIGLVLGMCLFAGCGNKQTETVQEAKINIQGKVFLCTSSSNKVFDVSNPEEPVEEYYITEDIKGDTVKEKMIMSYPEFQQNYEAIYTYQYDEAGYKIKSTCDINVNGNHNEIVMEYVNTYDNNGNLVKAEADNMVYEYENGQLVRLTINAALQIITEYENGKTLSTEQYEGEALKLREAYVYDVYGVKSSYEYYSSISGSESIEKTIDYNLEYEFNDDGYIKQITSTTEENEFKEIYKFDEYGNNISIEYYDGNGFMYQLEEFEYVEVTE